MSEARINVNGKLVKGPFDTSPFLVDFIRDRLQLTGTKIGCSTAECGACMIVLEGYAVRACTVLTEQADGKSVITVEGLVETILGPILQEEMIAVPGFQCGFCTAGILMDLLSVEENSSEPGDLHEVLERHLCRCGDYHALREVIRRLALRMSPASDSLDN